MLCILWLVYYLSLSFNEVLGAEKIIPFDDPKTRPQTDEERLRAILFRRYDPGFRPVYNHSKPVEIRFNLNLIQIGNMDEVNQVMEITAWQEMGWKEERLHWHPEHFNGLKMLRLPLRYLWIPDIILYNSADDSDRKRVEAEARVMVSHDGEIFLGPYVKLRSNCILDLTLYPYDEQRCRLVFGSRTYDSSQLVLKTKAKTIELSQYLESAKWELLESSVEPALRHHFCCKKPFQDIIITVKMRRRFLYNNLFNVMLPTMILNFLCLLCFYLPPESNEKITMGITILLTFNYLTWTIASQSPRTSDFVPLLSIYLTITMTLSAFVVSLQIFMINVHVMSPIVKSAPLWLQKLISSRVSKLLGIHATKPETTSNDRKKKKSTIVVKDHDAETWEHGLYLGGKSRRRSALQRFRRNLMRIIFHGEEYRMSDIPSLNRELSEDVLMQELVRTMSITKLRYFARDARFFESVERLVQSAEGCEYEPLVNCMSNSAQTVSKSASFVIERNAVNRLLRSVQLMAQRELEDAREEYLTNQWRMIAVIIDRMAFWFFLVFTTLSTFFLLIWLPLTKQTYPHPQDVSNVVIVRQTGNLFVDDTHDQKTEYELSRLHHDITPNNNNASSNISIPYFDHY